MSIMMGLSAMSQTNVAFAILSKHYISIRRSRQTLTETLTLAVNKIFRMEVIGPESFSVHLALVQTPGFEISNQRRTK